jgi:hypothetical protein
VDLGARRVLHAARRRHRSENENVWYVVGYEDHCVWKLEIDDMAAGLARVSVR